MYTNQSLFETVARHLFAQGERSLSTRGCAYRGVNGTSCAVGCVIPDDLYRESMEGRGIMGVLGYPGVSDHLKGVHESLLLDLQVTHDAPDSWENSNRMTDCLVSVGSEHGLSVSFLDSCYFGMNK